MPVRQLRQNCPVTVRHFSNADPGQFSDFFQNLFGGGWSFGEETEFWGGGTRRRRGRDHEATISITLTDSYHGARKSLGLNFDAVALVMELLDRIDDLERRPTGSCCNPFPASYAEGCGCICRVLGCR